MTSIEDSHWTQREMARRARRLSSPRLLPARDESRRLARRAPGSPARSKERSTSPRLCSTFESLLDHVRGRDRGPGRAASSSSELVPASDSLLNFRKRATHISVVSETSFTRVSPLFIKRLAWSTPRRAPPASTPRFRRRRRRPNRRRRRRRRLSFQSRRFAERRLERRRACTPKCQRPRPS